MSRFELCENSDPLKKKLPPMLMRSGQGIINLSMCTMALRNKGEESVRKRKKKLELRLG